MIQKPGEPFVPPKMQHKRQTWMDHYASLARDREKVNVLQLLKSRRDLNHDAEAGQILQILTAKWLTETYVD